MAFQGDSIYWVEVEKVVPNPFQPRREFDESKLKELAESIRMYGVLQPLTVTRKEVQRDDSTFYTEYELIAGERRLRASKMANVAQVPVIIREGEQSEQEKLELAIIENLQREDLNAVDRALAFRQLADAFGLSHAQVAEKVGRSREYVSNSIRLLGLPEHMLEALKHGDMSEGHARTLLMLNDKTEEQEVIFREILLKKLSVREVERIVRKIATDKVRKKNSGEFDAHLIEYEKQFTETLGTRVQIQKTDFGGKLTIDYFSEDDLATMLKRMGEEKESEVTETAQQIVEKLTTHTPLTVEHADPTPTSVPSPEAHAPADNNSENTVGPVPEAYTPAPEHQPERSFAAATPAPEAPSAPAEPPLSPRPYQATPPAPDAAEEFPATPAENQPSPTLPSEHPSDHAEASTPTPEEERTEEDDSNLYSIRNFSV